MIISFLTTAPTKTAKAHLGEGSSSGTALSLFFCSHQRIEGTWSMLEPILLVWEQEAESVSEELEK